MIRPIGTIYNCYGGLFVKKEGEKYYWAIEDYNGLPWEEITEELYLALNRYEDGRTQSN